MAFNLINLSNFYDSCTSRRSVVSLSDTFSSISVSSYFNHSHNGQIYQYSSLFNSSISKQKPHSNVFPQQLKYATSEMNCLTFEQKSLSKYSSCNTNSMVSDVPMINDSTINISSSSTDISTPMNKKIEKTGRLQIQDHLNKDGSRHIVMHKGV